MTPELDPETDLSFTRTLAAPRSLVWECWTDPKHIPHFFVPRPHRVTAVALDLRVGGRFNTTFEVEGAVMDNRGVYLEVVPEEKLVFTDGYTEGWKPAPDPFMTAILLLSDAPGGGTTYTAIARHRTAATRESHEKMGFFDGWGTVVDQLEAYARGLGS
ncbi:MAG: polyketide cyclase [Rhodovulum sulfidophilum]|uniref:Polyketide cyclase n=1 Tax=Rhodovulum sulfidophilum TaxID=35806 RepID=A0A2W5Q827_RHOSU|nr:MAG: polyketide cyclase [Rhodovulum sulfidophilum]